MADFDNRAKFGMYVAAGTLLGLGAGFLLGNLVGYMFLGMGSGFLVFALLTTFRNKNE